MYSFILSVFVIAVGCSNTDDIAFATNFLKESGYLEEIDTNVTENIADSTALEDAIFNFQEFFKLPVKSGELIEETLELIRSCCGVKDDY